MHNPAVVCYPGDNPHIQTLRSHIIYLPSRLSTKGPTFGWDSDCYRDGICMKLQGAKFHQQVCFQVGLGYGCLNRQFSEDIPNVASLRGGRDRFKTFHTCKRSKTWNNNDKDMLEKNLIEHFSYLNGTKDPILKYCQTKLKQRYCNSCHFAYREIESAACGQRHQCANFCHGLKAKCK